MTNEVFRLLLIVAGVFVTLLNVIATISVVRSPSLEKSKLPYQVAFIWVLPIFGAMLVLHLLREPPRYRQSTNDGGDHGYGDGIPFLGNESHDAVGGDVGGDGGGH